MHLPHIDPNFVLWCNLVSDVFTVLATGATAFAMLRLYWRSVRAEADRLMGKLK